MRRGEMERGIALDTAKHDIARRLRRVCQHFGRAEFEALVNRMAEIDVRYRLRDDWSIYQELRNSGHSRLRMN
jgi:IS1 family transposase